MGKAGVLCIWDAFTGKSKETIIKIGPATDHKIEFDATDKNFFIFGNHYLIGNRGEPIPRTLFFGMLDSDGHCLAYHEFPASGRESAF